MGQERKIYDIEFITENGYDKRMAVFLRQDRAVLAFVHPDDKNVIGFIDIPEKVKVLGLPNELFYNYGDIVIYYPDNITYRLPYAYHRMEKARLNRKFTNEYTEGVPIRRYAMTMPVSELFEMIEAMCYRFYRHDDWPVDSKDKSNHKVTLSFNDDGHSCDIQSGIYSYTISEKPECARSSLTVQTLDENEPQYRAVDIAYADFRNVMNMMMEQ